MEYRKAVYDFCPACGGLMKNGTCMFCGHVEKAEEAKAEEELTSADCSEHDGIPVPGREWQPETDSLKREWSPVPDGKTQKKSPVILLLGMGVFGILLVALLILALSLIVRDVRPGAFASEKKESETRGLEAFSQMESVSEEEREDGTFQLEGMPEMPDISGMMEKLEEIQKRQEAVEEAIEQDMQPHLMEKEGNNS